MTPVSPRISSHRLSLAEGWSIAWMLEVTATRSRAAGYTAAAAEFESGAESFRRAVMAGGPSFIDMTDATIENLTSMAWSLLDEVEAEPAAMGHLAAVEWARIGEQLLADDETGGAMTRFLTECSEPTHLPTYTASVIVRLRARAGIEADLAA